MARANTVKRTGTFEAARKRMRRICALLLVCLPVPSVLAAQTEADRESVNEVLESLFFAPSGTEIPYSPEAWSLVFARFAVGDSREVLIPAKAGEEYLVSGAAESFRADVDICVYDPAGYPVDCDTLPDYLPVVVFTAKMEGTYRAIMTAASVEGGGTAFAGMKVVKVVPDRGANPLGESNDDRTLLPSAERYGAGPAVASRMLDAGAGEHLTRATADTHINRSMARRCPATKPTYKETDNATILRDQPCYAPLGESVYWQREERPRDPPRVVSGRVLLRRHGRVHAVLSRDGTH